MPKKKLLSISESKKVEPNNKFEKLLRPTPWITDGSFERLERFIEGKDDLKVFEWGAGSSTVWLSGRSEISEIISINGSNRRL